MFREFGVEGMGLFRPGQLLICGSLALKSLR